MQMNTHSRSLVGVVQSRIRKDETHVAAEVNHLFITTRFKFTQYCSQVHRRADHSEIILIRSKHTHVVRKSTFNVDAKLLEPLDISISQLL